jgi:hypothetical protein
VLGSACLSRDGEPLSVLVAALMNYSVRVLRVEARVSVRVAQVATQIIHE